MKIILIQEELAREILSITDVTIIGILLAGMVCLTYAVSKLYKRCSDLEDLRVADKEKAQEVIVEMAEKTTTAISQVMDMAKLMNNG